MVAAPVLPPYGLSMLMVCLHGPPGVGKLTVGRELEERTGFILIHDHLTIETAAAVFPFAAPGFPELRSKLFSTLLDAACSTLRGIIITHANDVFWRPSFSEMVGACSEKHQYEVSRVFLRCARDEHERRISNPERGRYQKIIDIERLDRLTRAGEFDSTPAAPDDLLIDTTRQTAAEVAATIAASLGFRRKEAVGAH